MIYPISAKRVAALIKMGYSLLHMWAADHIWKDYLIMVTRATVSGQTIFNVLFNIIYESGRTYLNGLSYLTEVSGQTNYNGTLI